MLLNFVVKREIFFLLIFELELKYLLFLLKIDKTDFIIYKLKI